MGEVKVYRGIAGLRRNSRVGTVHSFIASVCCGIICLTDECI